MTANEKRAELVRLYRSRLRKNNYTQGSNRIHFWGKPAGTDPGYSDCSSSVRAVYLKLLGLDIGGNTEAQVTNGKGKIVDTTDGLYPNEANLKFGDLLYFKGNSAHAQDVQHVEMYTGKNRCSGHGSGVGPNDHNLRSYCQSRGKSRRYYKAIRHILDDDQPQRPAKLGDRPLFFGMENQPDVKELQTLLLKLGYDLGQWGADGDYGEYTARAVKGEQVHCQFAQTGNADLPTIQHIIAHATGQPAPAAKQRIKVTGGTVNVRSGPSTRHKALWIAEMDQVYDSNKDAADGWFGIVHKDGREGWISGKYAEVVQ